MCAALAVALIGSTAAAQPLESALSPGPLLQGHVKVENDCRACHIPFNRAAQDGLCIDCHKDVGQDIREHTGYHGRKEQQTCRTCHGDHRGRNAKLAEFDHKSFDHKLTDYPLLDKHQQVDCAKCHLAGKRWREAKSSCDACHAKDDVHKGGLGAKCEDCHGARGWKEVNFDHGKKTRFALADKHATAKCEACHAQGRYKDTSRTCIGCHRKEDDNKGHKGQFGEKCESCHNAKAWKPATFNHDVDTRYPLKDKHRTAKCTACHTGVLHKAKTPTACNDCHGKDDKHQGTLGKRCETCHNERNWKEPPNFDHAKTKFPLLGKHAKTPCKECHRDLVSYKQAPSDCIACHRKDDKHEGNLGTACQDCHGESAWKPILPRFDHQRTKFPLRNAHAAAKVKCADCHATPRAYRGIALDCVACHRKDDKHEGTLGSDCKACHGDVNWKVERFDHRRSRFALTGRHQIVECKACHPNLRYRETPLDCFSCHRKDDKHKAVLGEKCESCHSDRAWALWTFDHDRNTRYALEGKHRQVACAACHVAAAPRGKAIAPLPAFCDACHRKDDVHDGRYGRRCEICHAPTSWRQLKRPG